MRTIIICISCLCPSNNPLLTLAALVRRRAEAAPATKPRAAERDEEEEADASISRVERIEWSWIDRLAGLSCVGWGVGCVWSVVDRLEGQSIDRLTPGSRSCYQAAVHALGWMGGPGPPSLVVTDADPCRPDASPTPRSTEKTAGARGRQRTRSWARSISVRPWIRLGFCFV